MRTYAHTALSFSRLVRHLSHRSRLASALHVRNTLLSAYSSRDLYGSASIRSNTDDATRWDTLLHYLGDAGRVVAVGNVPSQVLADLKEGDGSGAVRGPWALIVTARRWKTPQGAAKPPRVHVWISCAPVIDSASDSGKGFETRRLELARWVFEEWMPLFASQTFHSEARIAAGSTTALPSPVSQPIVFSGMEQELADLVQKLSEVNETIKVQWGNPCSQFLCKVDSNAERPLPDDWSNDVITERDVELVRSSNKLPFPSDMIRARMHISVLLRLRRESAPDEERAMGWAYAHEDLSIGSLHVLPRYRRSKESALGVGATVVRQIERKLVFAAQRALIASGANEVDTQSNGVNEADAEGDGTFGVTPCCAMVEEENAISQAFFARLGYIKTVRNCWLGVAYTL